MDLDKALNRKEIARTDCSKCGGKGFKSVGGAEEVCAGPDEGGDGCGGSGFIEKEVPYAFDHTGLPKTPAQLANEAFGTPIPEIGKTQSERDE